MSSQYHDDKQLFNESNQIENLRNFYFTLQSFKTVKYLPVYKILYFLQILSASVISIGRICELLLSGKFLLNKF